MDKNWTIYLLVVIASGVVLVMARLDRLGKQLEAVMTNILHELERDPERKKKSIENGRKAKNNRLRMLACFGFRGRSLEELRFWAGHCFRETSQPVRASLNNASVIDGLLFSTDWEARGDIRAN